MLKLIVIENNGFLFYINLFRIIFWNKTYRKLKNFAHIFF